MSASSVPVSVSLETPHVTLTLRRRSPNWDLTIENTGTESLWIDNRTLVTHGDRVTISRRIRKPSFQIQLSSRPHAWYSPTDIAKRIQIAPSESVAGEINCLVIGAGFSAGAEPAICRPFKFVPPPPPVFTGSILPLRVTVLPPHEGDSGYTLLQMRNTSTTDTLQVDGCELPPGVFLTFTAREITSALLRQFHVTTAEHAMFLATVWNDELQETMICEPLHVQGRLYRCANPPMEVLVTPRPHGADPEVLVHNTSLTKDLWIADQRVPPSYLVKGGLDMTIMSPITRCEYKCTVSDTEVTLTVTIQDASTPMPDAPLSNYTYVTPGRLPRLERAKGPFEITVVEPPLDPDTATEAVNTLLRALSTTHQEVATEILTAHGLTPGQITAVLAGLAAVM